MRNRSIKQVGDDQRYGGTGAPAQTRALLARLGIEGQLRHLGLATSVSGNQILLQAEEYYTLIEVLTQTDHQLTVRMRTVLGEVLLADEAKSYLDSIKAEASPSVVELTDDGVLSVCWTQDFTGEVHPAAVLTALNRMSGFVDSIHTVLMEDCYLQPARGIAARLRTGGAQ